MIIGLVQTNPQDNTATNVSDAVARIRSAAEQGVHTVVLPEVFSYMGTEAGRLESAEHLGTGIFAKLAQVAKECEVNIVGGSHSERAAKKDRVFNTAVSYDNTGEVLSVYRKVHLFNLKDAEGNPLYCESNVFESGRETNFFEIKAGGEHWKCLTAICYDLRFPELFRKQISVSGPLDIIFLPAAFTHQTGMDHWEVLLRARAIENQCYVVACNQTGFHSDGKKRNYGHSMVVDPWGRVVGSLNEEVGTLLCTLKKEAISEARLRLPALADRVFL